MTASEPPVGKDSSFEAEMTVQVTREVMDRLLAKSSQVNVLRAQVASLQSEIERQRDRIELAEKQVWDLCRANAQLERQRETTLTQEAKLLRSLSDYDWDDVLDRIPDAWGSKEILAKLRLLSSSPLTRD